MARRGASGLSGILLVDKPAGITSHDVISTLRRTLEERRIGHAGTLDPAATGLLVILVGPYTRLSDILTSAEKAYRATITFGSSTDTDDSEGRVTATSAVPDALSDDRFARDVLSRFIGAQSQTPPAYSAIKQGGVAAHRAARAGQTVEIPPRDITVISADLVSLDADRAEWTIDFFVSKGTYIRALARDIGSSAGTHAHLSGLRRTSCGSLSVDDALPLERLSAMSAEEVSERFLDPLQTLCLPILAVDADSARLIRNGRSVPASDFDVGTGSRVAVSYEGDLLGVYLFDGEALRPEVVFPGSAA